MQLLLKVKLSKLKRILTLHKSYEIYNTVKIVLGIV